MQIEEFENIRKFKCDKRDTTTNDVRFRELSYLAPKIGTWGSCLEFGVFSGATINHISSLLPNMKFHGFDSFEGLPEDWNMGGKMVKKESFDRQGNMPEVNRNVHLYKGWFSDTLTPWLGLNTMPVSFLHIDSDVYSSAAYVLDTLNYRIRPGTIIRFDELSCWRTVFSEVSPPNVQRVGYSTWEDHEWKALNEWLTKYDRKVTPISRDWFQGGSVIVTQ
jgi:hypothetical protein